MATIFDVANWFLTKEPLTHKKMQKLCYYAQAWSYALRNKTLCNADFEAWVHGPVNLELYQEYKGNSYQDIALSNDAMSYPFAIEDQELLESIWETFKDYSGNALEVMTHREQPWMTARRGLKKDEQGHNIISPENMRTFYKSLVDENPESEAYRR